MAYDPILASLSNPPARTPELSLVTVPFSQCHLELAVCLQHHSRHEGLLNYRFLASAPEFLIQYTCLVEGYVILLTSFR